MTEAAAVTLTVLAALQLMRLAAAMAEVAQGSMEVLAGRAVAATGQRGAVPLAEVVLEVEIVTGAAGRVGAQAEARAGMCTAPVNRNISGAQCTASTSEAIWRIIPSACIRSPAWMA